MNDSRYIRRSGILTEWVVVAALDLDLGPRPRQGLKGWV